MIDRFPPVTRIPHLLHGGDYNPEQWSPRKYPDLWDQDMRLMKLAGVNIVSVGIFSWAQLEPLEGRFDFGWLDRILDLLAEHGIAANLATPSGAKPNWMAAKYPQIRRVTADGHRDLQGGRHNHCYTSPVYRAKVKKINTRLAQRYKDHPALAMWHISNEYGGECHCDLCKEAFRAWLRKRYRTLEELNHAWWTTFWSHRYQDWSQIELIDRSVHGLVLDWKRFVTDQTVDFMRHEIEPLRRLTPGIPITTNMMGTYPGLNYWKFRDVCDVVCWDSYPGWHTESEMKTASWTAFVHDLNRSLKRRPFLLMESTPSQVNWQQVSPLKRPGLHRTASLQAVAHGADAVMYFQWRKSRGSAEKFHGAVVDHVGHEHTRVFQEVAALGADLKKLDGLVGASNPVETAIIYDWENGWALEAEQGPRNTNKDYARTCSRDFYDPLWKHHVPVDIIDMDQELAPYRLVIAPMLYMVRPGVAQRLQTFVERGGTLVTTYFSGLVNESDLCFLDGFPGPLKPVLGIWAEETDVLPDDREQMVVPAAGHPLGLKARYAARHYCDLIHVKGDQVRVLATYGRDFYAGRPALTVNPLGCGQAYYIASRNDQRFCDDFMAGLIRQLKLRRNWAGTTPPGVSVQRRNNGKQDFLFFLNFTDAPRTIRLNRPTLRDALTGKKAGAALKLPPYGSAVLAS